MGKHPQPQRRIGFTKEAEGWYQALGPRDTHRVNGMVDRLAAGGPGLGRPDVDHVKGARHHNLKELRSRGTCLRVLFAFDKNQDAIMLVGGDKRAEGKRWYRSAVRQADRVYDDHLRTGGKEVTWHEIPATGRASEQRSR